MLRFLLFLLTGREKWGRILPREPGEKLVVPHDPSLKLSCSSVLCRQQRRQQLRLSSVGPPDRTPASVTAHPQAPAEGPQDSVWVLKATLSPEAVRARRSCQGPWGRLRKQQGHDSSLTQQA